MIFLFLILTYSHYSTCRLGIRIDIITELKIGTNNLSSLFFIMKYLLLNDYSDKTSLNDHLQPSCQHLQISKKISDLRDFVYIIITMGFKDFLEKLGIKRKKKNSDSIEHPNP